MLPDPRACAPLSRHRRRSWYATIIAVGGLAALAFAHWFTYEPAAAVRVRWREGVSERQQVARERMYLLVNRQAPHPDAPTSFAYDLLDTSSRNVRAIVEDPLIADTNDIDRERFAIPLETAPGERWMWAAHRIPVLRRAAVRWTLVTILAVMAVAGTAGLLTRNRCP